MENKQKMNFSEATGKPIGDKCSAYESSRTDSGFISSGNLLFSEEIVSEEFKAPESKPKTDNKNPKATSTATDLDSGIIDDETKYDDMRLDSGCCLAESISNLNIQETGLNDLSCSKSPSIILKASPVESKSNYDDKPWNIYYEQDEDGDTYLHLAIRQGLAEVVLALIRVAFHPRLLDTPNDDNQTPLHLAVESGQWRVVRWLRVAGARPCPRDSNGDSPLHTAARNGDLKCVRAITEPVQKHERETLGLSQPLSQMYQTCDMDQWNYVGQTCVHVAAMYGQVDVLKQLVQSGANINAREGLDGMTAFHYAVQRRDETLVQYLITECKSFNPHETTYGGRNALQLNPVLPPAISNTLRSLGLSSPYSSDDSDSSDEEANTATVNYTNKQTFIPNLVNASA